MPSLQEQPHATGKHDGPRAARVAAHGSNEGRPIALPEPIQPDLPNRLWSHKETAAFLGIPEATLHQLNYKGMGPRSFKVGRHPRDLHDWLAERSSDYFG